MQAPAPHGPGLPKHDPSVYQCITDLNKLGPFDSSRDIFCFTVI